MKAGKAPLYRRVNTRTHGVTHGGGRKSRWERNTKTAAKDTGVHGSMHGKRQNGLDYTPLFRFLLSQVGRDWNDVHSEAVRRVDREEPIYWLVARTEEARQPVVRVGESSYFSGLFVDDQNKLAIVDPSVTVDTLEPRCACCTHTLNGQRLTKPFSDPNEKGDATRPEDAPD